MRRALLMFAVCAAPLGSAASASANPRGISVAAVDATRAVALERRANEELVTRELAVRLARTPCDGCRVDVTITDLAIEIHGAEITVDATLGVALCDAHGLALSVVSSKARAATKRGGNVATLRADALTSAVDGASSKITASLDRVRRPAA